MHPKQMRNFVGWANCFVLAKFLLLEHYYNKISNIFSRAYCQMQTAYALQTVNYALENVLDHGATKLYDRYLNQKLPQHTHTQNNTTFHENMSMQAPPRPSRTPIEFVPLAIVPPVPIDTNAPKRISIKKYSNNFSTLSPKNTTIDKSTKYQTIIHSQKSTIDRQQNNQNINDTMLPQQQNCTESLLMRNGRPMTMQTAREKNRLSNNLMLESNIEEVEEKRAATCHTRKRKTIVSKDKKETFIKIKDQIPIYLYEEMETANRLRHHKKEQFEEQQQKQHEKAKINAYIMMKEKKAIQNLEILKKKLKGKSKDSPALTNFQSANGEIFINGRPKQPKTHIIQLEFNPEDERTQKTLDPKVAGVNATKKGSFITKKTKKLKITNEEFTNNGGRQISSIPFLSLNYGVALSQSTLEATASRRRPSEQMSRDKFNIQNFSHRFKSHIPIVNSARLNAYMTIDEAVSNNNTITKSWVESGQKKDMETTFESRKQMQNSLLWHPRGKSENKNIRISNRQAFKAEILDLKLGYCQ